MVEVLVEYDYTAKEPDELTIKKGDIIREVVKKPGGWWEGLLNDKKGMFPDNFVRVVEKDTTNSVTFRNKRDTNRIRQCRVVFSYKQDHPDELNLSIGDVVNILGEEEEGWWRGLLNGKEGVFPSNFVEEIKSKPGSREDLTNVSENDIKSPSLPPKPTKTLCQVKYSYKAQNEDELSLKEGDIITLISKDGQDVGWWKGELNGKVGVFPDNFVAVLSDQTQSDERNHKDDRKLTKTPDLITPPKVPVTSSQRKSLEKQDQHDDGLTKVTPPVPSKKPLIPIKKSPSGSGSQGGLLSGLRKKIVDVVDGASGSKSQPVLIKANEIKEDGKLEIMSTTPENAFDQVERTSMLSDVRATRAKAPGRRPPSVVFKEGEPGIVNGNTDHAPLDSLTEHLSNSRSSTISNDQTENEVKPKVREWEKHKAPWLEEMKLNQAKRTSTSPGPEQHKLKLTPSERNSSGSPEVDEQSKSAKTSPFEKNSSSPIDMSKSMSAINNKLKTPPNELEKTPVILRNKPPQPIPSAAIVRPQSIHSSVAVTNLNDTQPQKPFSISHTPTTITAIASPRLSPAAPSNHSNNNNKTSPSARPPIAEKSPDVKVNNDVSQENTTAKQYVELLQRIEKLESLVEQQHQMHKAAIEELKGKLQVETDMRRLLQAELDRVSSQCIMQV